MKLRERRDIESANRIPTAGSPGVGLDNVRQAGADLLAAGDEAIRRALSGDSEKFLEANRQHGGQ